MNILLVDDEILEVEQLEFLLKPYFPYSNFLKAKDASQALDLIKAYSIQLAFIDIHMPGKSGLKLAEHLKQLQPTKIIIVTAYQSFEFAQTALRIKIDDFITKPVIESELHGAIKPFLNQGNLSTNVYRATEIIHERYQEKLSLQVIADMVHVNQAYLSRKFNEEVNMSFSDYINQYRIEVAKRILIEQPQLNISQVAEECGFSSQHYFSSSFKKLLGTTPREYRMKSGR